MSDPHKPRFEVRDPIYGFVKLSEAEWDIVNCPEFQRLRDIKQLAMGHMVYPGAVHTRFEHSLGCLHLSSLMFDALVESTYAQEVLGSEFSISDDDIQRARKLMRLAALLHDLGHPPFSHSGESLLPKSPESGEKLSHEDMSANLIRDSTIGEVIRQRFNGSGILPEEVALVATSPKEVKDYKPQAYHSFLNELLTGELGSDRIDYLLRDAYHSGQNSGQFDYRRLISSLTLVEPPKEEESGHKIGFDSGGWLVAEQMVVSRYLMYQSLYFHKTKRIYEKHLEAFIAAWLPNGVLPHEPVEYIKLSDSDVTAAIHDAYADPSSEAHNRAQRFHRRGHLRLAKELILADNLSPDSRGLRRLPCKDRFDALANFVREKFGQDDTIVFDEPDHSAMKLVGGTNKILVRLDDEPRYLEDISEIVRGMSTRIWRGRVYCEPEPKELRSEVSAACNDWLAKNPVDNFKKSGDKHATI